MDKLLFGETLIADKVQKNKKNELHTLEKDVKVSLLDVVYMNRIDDFIIIVREVNSRRNYYGVDVKYLNQTPEILFYEQKWDLSNDIEFPNLIFYTNIRRLEKNINHIENIICGRKR